MATYHLPATDLAGGKQYFDFTVSPGVYSTPAVCLIDSVVPIAGPDGNLYYSIFTSNPCAYIRLQKIGSYYIVAHMVGSWEFNI